MTTTDRFFAKVDKNGPIPAHRPELGPCWTWLAAKVYGYGYFFVGSGNRRAHRVSWEMAKGPIPEGRQLDHLCRNHGCVNPDHLEPVTNRENTIRGDSPRLTRERWALRTECAKGHPFTAESTRRRSRPDGTGERVCRICHRAYMRAHMAAKRAADPANTPKEPTADGK